MMQSAEVRVGWVWLSSLGPWGDLEIEDRWPGGNYELRCTLDPRLAQRHPAIVNDAPVIATVGGVRWAGTLAEYDPEDGKIVAQGYYRQGDGAPALNSAGMTTTVPDHAIDRGISAGWLDWRRPVSLSAVAYSSPNSNGDATVELNPVGSLLDEWAAGAGKRWGVDEQRIVYADSDPGLSVHRVINTTAATQSGANAAGTVVARWQGSTGKYSTTIRGNARPIVTVDFTNAGPLTSSQVTARCDQILSTSKGAATIGGFTLARDQIIGRPHLSTVRAGQRVALVDQVGPDLTELAPNVILGTTVWKVDEGVVECTPVDAPDLDLQSIIEKLGGSAA